MAKASDVLAILLWIVIVALVLYYFILSKRVVSTPTPTSSPSSTPSSSPSSPPSPTPSASANPTVTITLNY